MSQPLSDVQADPSADLVEPQFLVRHVRIALTSGILICIGLAALLCRVLPAADVSARSGTLFQHPHWVTFGLIAGMTLLIGAVVSAVMASHANFEGGLLCGAAGLTYLSTRCGTMRFSLFQAQSYSNFYLGCAVETLFYLGVLLLAWKILRMWWGQPRRVTEPAEPLAADEPLDQKLLALAAQCMAMLIVMFLLCQSDTKAQALCSVGVASWAGTLAAQQIVRLRSSAWYLLGPMIVAVFGYGIAAVMKDTGVAIGDPSGYLAALVRPLPLDYASAGTIGALIAFWSTTNVRNVPDGASDLAGQLAPSGT